jgi:hypothetical protein
VNVFELEMDAGEAFNRMDTEVACEPDQHVCQHRLHVLGRGSNVGADADVLAGDPEAASDLLIDVGQQHLVKEKHPIEGEWLSVIGADVVDDTSKVLSLVNLPEIHVTRDLNGQQNPLRVLKGER